MDANAQETIRQARNELAQLEADTRRSVELPGGVIPAADDQAEVARLAGLVNQLDDLLDRQPLGAAGSGLADEAARHAWQVMKRALETGHPMDDTWVRTLDRHFSDPLNYEWLPIEDAPNDGTLVLVTNGEAVWISSRRTGAQATPGDPSGPIDGHDWYMSGHRTRPVGWLPIPPTRAVSGGVKETKN